MHGYSTLMKKKNNKFMNFNKETKKATEKQYLNGKGKLKVSKVRVSSSLMTNQQKPGKSRKWLGIFLKKKKKRLWSAKGSTFSTFVFKLR